MSPKEQAEQIKQEVGQIIEKWKVSEPVLHERLLKMDISILVAKKMLAVSTGNQYKYYSSVLKIIKDEK